MNQSPYLLTYICVKQIEMLYNQFDYDYFLWLESSDDSIAMPST